MYSTSSLLQTFVKYVAKKLKALSTGANAIKLFILKLQIIVQRQGVCAWQAFQAWANKHSSLLQTFVNYGCKKLYNIVTRSMGLLKVPAHSRSWKALS